MSGQPLRLWGLQLAGLLLLGLLVGLACWPLNLMDHAQDLLLHQLPGFSGDSWTLRTLAIALAPVGVMPLLLLLQSGRLARGAGSGIPQTLESIENPSQAPLLMAPFATVARLALWSAASLALMPLGREGPVVQVGAAVAHALRRRFPNLLAGISPASLMAIGAGAGLAGGFNSPLMGTVFVFEELTGRFQPSVIWPAAVVCSAAALISNLDGIPLFTLGVVQTLRPEWQQLLWALPLGVGGGLLGGLFSRILWQGTSLSAPATTQTAPGLGSRARNGPWPVGPGQWWLEWRRRRSPDGSAA